MKALILTGPKGTDPLGWLCALGTFRVVVEALDASAKLAFDDGGRPVLHTVLDRAGLIAGLVRFARERAARPELTLADTLKFDPAAWATLALAWRTQALGDAPESLLRAAALPFVAAYTSDLVTAGSGDTKPTALDMTAGQQKFVESIRNLLDTMTAMPKKKGKLEPVDPAPAFVEEALFGPWRYRDDVHALGWDPSGEGLGAFTHDAPAKLANESVRAAVWLAWEALPLHPVFARPGTWKPRLDTTGFRRVDGKLAMVWALWAPAISLEAVATVMTQGDLGDAFAAGYGAKSARDRLAARGVRLVCRSERADLGNKGYAIFRAPVVLRLTDPHPPLPPGASRPHIR